jgi:hypothetical protein
MERVELSMKEKSWEEFRDSGLFWWINMLLHTFGWAIVTEVKDGQVMRVYPARVVFRGFNEKHNTEGYIRVSQYMQDTAKDLNEEARN